MSTKNLTAMVIEDDAKQAEIFTKALTLVGFEAQIVSNGAAALSLLETQTPNLILLDLHLPGVSGDQILTQIRAMPQLDNTKVIIASADPGMAFQLNEETDLVLIKPISFHQLKELASRLFQ